MLPTFTRYASSPNITSAIKIKDGPHNSRPSFAEEWDAICKMKGQIEVLQKPLNPFEQDPNYEWVKGNPAHGIAVLYPQNHYLDQLGGFIKESRELKHQIYLSQAGIYKDFCLKKPEHIYVEAKTSSEIQELKKGALLFRKINDTLLNKLNNEVKLTESEIELFIQVGGAGWYAISCWLKDTPVKLHASLTNEEKAELNSKLSNNLYLQRRLHDPANKKFLFTDQEKKLEDVVMQTAGERNNTPAYIVFGGAHSFDSIFSNPDSPALYRRLGFLKPTLTEMGMI
ncbi:MAG: hypothetical protein K0R08_1778 [Solimicrobium sp.]|jgi:hypothetical protein|nr:hypothetical protein [Solimicrobium sp.]